MRDISVFRIHGFVHSICISVSVLSLALRPFSVFFVSALLLALHNGLTHRVLQFSVAIFPKVLLYGTC